jgi:ornithine cyclodeaminase/alanine dehydrogenase-like protein (mu-crystallin family)
VETLILSRSEVAALLEPHIVLTALRDAFVAYSTGRTIDAMRIPLTLPPRESGAGSSGMLLAPGLVPGIPAYSIKVHAKFPGQDPAIRGVLVLHDLATGAVLALIESSHLTALRTGLAGALGADALARRDARTVAIIGAGAQGRSQLAALRLVRPITAVNVLDTVSSAARSFAHDPVCDGLAVRVVDSLDEALVGADVVVTSTWAQEPFLFRRHLQPGMHLTNVGADQPGRCEISADALQAAVVVVDDRRLAVEMGVIGGAGLDDKAIHAELGEVLAGLRPGRSGPDDITVFGSVGLAFQDLAAGWRAYTLARERGIGRSVRLLD